MHRVCLCWRYLSARSIHVLCIFGTTRSGWGYAYGLSIWKAYFFRQPLSIHPQTSLHHILTHSFFTTDIRSLQSILWWIKVRSPAVIHGLSLLLTSLSTGNIEYMYMVSSWYLWMTTTCFSSLNYGLVTPNDGIWTNIGSGNGLLPTSTKQLVEPMLT